MVRWKIIFSGIIIGGALFVAGYFFEIPYTNYILLMALAIIFLGFIVPKPKPRMI